MTNLFESSLFERDRCLKGHIYFNKVAEGVYFQGQAGGFILKGDGIYPLVAKIISFIDAGFSLQDIQSKLPEKLRPFFVNLMTQLDQHQMLMPRGNEKLVPDGWMDFTHFRDLFRYLNESASDFAHQFPQWQKQKIAIIGDGYALKSAVEGIATSGVKSLTVVLTKDLTKDSVGKSEILNALNDYADKLPGFEGQVMQVNECQSLDVSGFDQVLYCSTELEPDHAYYQNAEQPSLIAGLLFGQAVVTPLSSVSQAGFNDIVEQMTRVAANDELLFPKAGLSMLGSIAALNVIKGFFDIDVDGLSNYVYRVSPHLEMSRHPLLPTHAQQISSDAVTQFQAEFEMPDDRELEQYEQVKLALGAYFDPLLGCLDESVGKDIKQVPLFHAKLRLHFPSSMELVPKDVMCSGLNAATAGLRSIASALSLRTAAQLQVSPATITTDFDEQSWKQNAYAQLLARSAGFAESAHSVRINLMRIDDEEMQLLFHFLQSAGYKQDALSLYWNDSYNSFVAQIQLPNSNKAMTKTMTAIAANPYDAIRECLCCVYVRLQFHDVYFANSSLEFSAPESFDETGEALAHLLQANASAIPSLTMVQGDPLLQASSIYSGYAALADVSEQEEV